MAEKRLDEDKGKPLTPKMLRETQENLEDAATAYAALALVVAGAAIFIPFVKKEVLAYAIALEGIALAFEKLARDYGRLADELQDFQNPSSSPVPPGATPNVAPRSPDSLLGPDFMSGSPVTRMQEATEAGWQFADALGQIEQAGQGLADVLSIDDARLAAVADTLDRAAQNVDGFGDSMTELKDIGERVFGRLQEVLVDFTETGKFEWQDLARVALDAISDIFAAQVGSSGGGGPLGGIGSILSSITSTLGGLFGGGSTPTPLQLSGPFQHGGSFVVGGSGAPDSRLVSFLATPGERVDVLTPAQQGAFGGGAPVVNITQNFDFKGASLEAVALLRREANRIKHELMAEIIASAQRGGAFARMSRI